MAGPTTQSDRPVSAHFVMPGFRASSLDGPEPGKVRTPRSTAAGCWSVRGWAGCCPATNHFRAPVWQMSVSNALKTATHDKLALRDPTYLVALLDRASGI